jgi:hypothetical protein
MALKNVHSRPHLMGREDPMRNPTIWHLLNGWRVDLFARTTRKVGNFSTFTLYVIHDRHGAARDGFDKVNEFGDLVPTHIPARPGKH